jgi:hypothetical protein
MSAFLIFASLFINEKKQPFICNFSYPRTIGCKSEFRMSEQFKVIIVNIFIE